MKKKIAIIGLDSRACSFYAQEVESLFGDYADVIFYSMDKGIVAEALPKADLYAISTDIFGISERINRNLPIDSQMMEIDLAYKTDVIEKLEKLPEGCRVLFVNLTETIVRESIGQLTQLGIQQVQFIPYYPGADVDDMPDLAVTPDEAELVPSSVRSVINIGHRSCSSGMMIEIAIRLGLEKLLETRPFRDYLTSIAGNNYSFERMFTRSNRLESQFRILLEILDEGLIGVNEKGKIFACNQKACQITGNSENLITGHACEEIFPYIPFLECFEKQQKIPNRVMKISGADIGVSVMPVMRRNECIGAFATLQKFREMEKRQNELRTQLLDRGHCARYSIDDVIGESQCICRVKDILPKMAVTSSPVLIMGETGTGKELLAHAVHKASLRKNGPFIAINVAAMPENLLESELFGYEEGAFTGAKKGGSPGLFEFAHGGTLFLDEVEGMTPAMQVKLLRVLQEGEIMRVGGTRIIKVDVRIVAATNESLEKKVEEGSFRKDLYYRLNALTISVPTLHERGDDILLLLDCFRKELGGTFELSEEVRRFLLDYSWPGNIRELHNVAEYFIYMDKQTIGMEDLPQTLHGSGHSAVQGDSPNTSVADGGSASGYSGEETDIQDPYWFVLRQLFRAAQQGELIGRQKILEQAAEVFLPFSQKDIRDSLGRLQEDGYVRIRKGRGGSRITPSGRAHWLNHCSQSKESV